MKRNPGSRSGVVRQPLSVRYLRRLLPAVMAGFLAAFFAVVTVGYLVQRQKVNRLRAEMAAVYAKALAKPLWDCDRLVAESIVNTLQHLPEIAGVRLQAPCDQINIQLGALPNSNLQYIVGTDVYHRTPSGSRMPVGFLLVQYNRIHVWDRLMSDLWAVMVILLALAGLLAFVSVRLHGRLVSAPLDRFRVLIARNREGGGLPGLEELEQFCRNRSDEIGAVAGEFYDLMHELRLRLQRQQVLSRCARLLLNSTEGGGELQSVLMELLPAVEADRIHCYVNEESNDGTLAFSLKYEACVPEVMSELDNPGLEHCRYLPDLLRWREAFLAMQPVAGPVAAMTDSERYVAGTGGARSVLFVPVWNGSDWLGVLGVADMQEEREWNASELLFMQAAADLLGSYYNRLGLEQRLTGLAAAENALAVFAESLLNRKQGDTVNNLERLAAGISLDGLAVYRIRNREEAVPVDAFFAADPSGRPVMPPTVACGDSVWAGYVDRLEQGEVVFTDNDAAGFAAAGFPGGGVLLPLRTSGRLSGFLFGYERTAGAFSSSCDLRILQTAAGIYSSYLESLYNQQIKEDIDRIVRHDLKTPLSGIISISQILEMDDNLSPEQRGMLQQLRRQGDKMLRYINFSLDLHRIEMDLYRYRPESVDLAGILRDLLFVLEPRATVKKQHIAVTVEGEPLHAGTVCVVSGDELLLHSMLENLTVNALDAADSGETVSVSVNRAEGCRIAVHNPGVVAHEIRDRFFEKFVSHGKRHGTGLGTYSAKLMAEIMGGTITMQSSPDLGTTVTVVLPAGS